MDLQLKGNLALVTGSTSDIGEGIAQVLTQERAVVVVQGMQRSLGKRRSNA